MPQRCLEQGFVRAVICRNCTTGQATASSSTRDLRPRAKRQPHLAEIRRWRRQSVQMGRKICVCLSSNSLWQLGKMSTNIVRCSIGPSRCCELANPAQVRQIASQTGVLLCRMRFVAGRGADEVCCRQGRCGRDGAKRKSVRKRLPLRGSRCGTIGKKLPLRGRTFGSATGGSAPRQGVRKMVIINLLVCWREPVVYHSVYVLLNDGFEEGILFGQ